MAPAAVAAQADEDGYLEEMAAILGIRADQSDEQGLDRQVCELRLDALILRCRVEGDITNGAISMAWALVLAVFAGSFLGFLIVAVVAPFFVRVCRQAARLDALIVVSDRFLARPR